MRAVISNRSASESQRRAIATLKACGATIVSLANPYVHAKAIVADGTRAYVGSANLSADSLDKNRELGIITSAADVVTVVAASVAKDIAAGTSF